MRIMRFLRICLHSPHPPYPKLIRTLLHLTWCRLGPSLTLGLLIYWRRRELRGLPRSRSQRPTIPPPTPPPPPPPPNYHPWAWRHQSVALGTAAVPSLSDSRRC
ncbi:hypothetical protein GDO81_006421 [Engystomops pustulosus]|uniref:Uncharacterized protein n=1 Tax=Engystomops pustulosus TaxID=76066 RepID=A0AAV7CXA7_ENGPU|nr:hypothetical protein GDO81_006421 [Engystomops pustulosus]